MRSSGASAPRRGPSAPSLLADTRICSIGPRAAGLCREAKRPAGSEEPRGGDGRTTGHSLRQLCARLQFCVTSFSHLVCGPFFWDSLEDNLSVWQAHRTICMGLEAVISRDLTRQSFQDPITHGDSTASETTLPPEGALAAATPPGRGYTLGIQGKPPGLSTAQEKGLDTTGVHP